MADPYTHVSHAYGHDFNDDQPGGNNNENLLHAIRAGVMAGNEYRVLNLPRCRIWDSVGEVGHGPGAAATTFNNTSYDSDSMSGNSGITVKTSGLYGVSGGLLYSTGTGSRQSYFVVNGVSFGIMTTPTAAGGIQHNIHDYIVCNKGDLIQLFANTVTDASNILGGVSSKYLTAVLVSTIG